VPYELPVLPDRRANLAIECQHRMPCAKCDFYTPKDSSRAQLLEAQANPQRMLVAIPLTDDERAVSDGQAALDKLLGSWPTFPRPQGQRPARLQKLKGLGLELS
jgi:hypothetical protein